MAPLSAIRASNAASARALKGIPVAVFVGGTSGIGQGMTEAFSRWTEGKAHIVIVGRSRQSAESILSNFPKPSSSSTWSHEFIQCDATLMKNVYSTSQEILRRYPKINFLVETQGILTLDGRTETEEGIDRKLALHYYSRWKFIYELLPALKKAQEEGEEAKVLSVLGAGKGGEVNLNDLGLVKTFSLTNAALQAPTYNDLMMEEFADRNPGLTFIHGYPGYVKTSQATNPSTLLRVAGKISNVVFAPFAVSQDTAGEYMWNALFSNTGGAFRTGSLGENLEKKRYFGNEEQRQKLWEHTVEMTKVAS